MSFASYLLTGQGLKGVKVSQAGRGRGTVRFEEGGDGGRAGDRLQDRGAEGGGRIRHLRASLEKGGVRGLNGGFGDVSNNFARIHWSMSLLGCGFCLVTSRRRSLECVNVTSVHPEPTLFELETR